MARESRHPNEPVDRAEASPDELFDLLGNDRRRAALEVLLAEGGGIPFEELVDRVAAREYDKPAEQLDSRERKRVQDSLQQTHLPRLQRRGFVSWDREADVIESSPTLRELDVYLQVTDSRTVPFTAVYLALSLVSSVALGGAVLGLAPFAALTDVAWLTAVVGAFGLVSMVHYHHVRRRKVEMEGFVPDVDVDPQGDGTDPDADSWPVTILGSLAGGLLAGLGSGLVFHFALFLTPLVGSVYGRPTAIWGLLAHLGHSVALALAFGLATTRTRLRWFAATTTGVVGLALVYGVALWVLLEGVALPLWIGYGFSGLATVAGRPVLYLPFDGLAAHVLFGGLLGGGFAGVRRLLSQRE